MTTTALPVDRPRTAVRDASFASAVSFEWVKLRTLRSSWWTAVTAVALLVLWALATAAIFHQMEVLDPASATADGGPLIADAATGGMQFGQLTIGVLGVLVITNEYSSGMIRSTFAAVPRRATALLAKVALVVMFTLVVAAAGLALAYCAAWGMYEVLGVTHVEDVTRNAESIVGAAFVLICAVLMALGFGLILRSTAGAISAVVVILFITWIALAPFQTNEVAGTISNLLPTGAGSWLFATEEYVRSAQEQGYQTLTQVQAFAVVASWAVVPIAAGMAMISKRDV